MNTSIDPKTGEEIIYIIANTGKRHFGIHDVSRAKPINPILKKIKLGKSLAEKEKDLIANFLYLNTVMDQGRDPEGVRDLLVRVTNISYRNNIRFLHNPNYFFKNPSFFSRILREEHQKVKKERTKILKIRAYSLFDTKINPYTMHRWGTVMLCLKKLIEARMSLLSFMKSARRANKVPNLIRNDAEYGLGNAIGYKATRLLIKWLIHTFGIIKGDDLLWGKNSYEIPLDSNVGGIFMRSGLLFLFATEDELWQSNCWIRQRNGRVNLSAQRLNDLRIKGNSFIINDLNKVLRKWGVRKKNMMKVINAFILRLERKGIDISIGQLDDGFMHIGQNFCKNERLPLCIRCPLSGICIANNKESLLKRQYYCGAGQGVFY